MDRRVLSLAAALALLPLAATPALAGDLDFSSAKVKFKSSRRATDGGATTALLVVQGGMRYKPALMTFDPRADRLALTVGPETVLDTTGLPVQARLKTRTDGRWTLQLRRPLGPGSGLKLSMAQVSGIFTLRVKGLDGAALLAGGPGNVPFSLTLGEETWSSFIPFDQGAGNSWSYTRPFTPNHPGGGGGGGGGGGSGGGGGDQSTTLPFQTVQKGTYSGLAGPHYLVIRDQASLVQLWQRPGMQYAPSPPPISVDWSTRMLIVAMVGPRPTGGYAATITGVRVQGSTIYVTVREDQPGQNCIVTSATTYPFHIVETARVDGTASFQVDVKVVDCR